jgi:hypothetical protein
VAIQVVFLRNTIHFAKITDAINEIRFILRSANLHKWRWSKFAFTSFPSAHPDGCQHRNNPSRDHRIKQFGYGTVRTGSKCLRLVSEVNLLFETAAQCPVTACEIFVNLMPFSSTSTKLPWIHFTRTRRLQSVKSSALCILHPRICPINADTTIKVPQLLQLDHAFKSLVRYTSAI